MAIRELSAHCLLCVRQVLAFEYAAWLSVAIWVAASGSMAKMIAAPSHLVEVTAVVV